MKIMRSAILAVLVSLLIVGAQGFAAKPATVVSNKEFKPTVDAVVKAIKARGMMVVAQIDHQNMLKMVGVEIGGSTTIEFGKPEMGKMVMTMDAAAGAEMPARIYIFEKDGKTHISYTTPHFAQYHPKFADVDKMMGMTLKEIAGEAAR